MDVGFIHGDLFYPDNLRDQIPQGVDAIFHLAAAADVNMFAGRPRVSYLTNTEAVLNLMRVCTQMPQPPHVFLASTVWVCGCVPPALLTMQEIDGIIPNRAKHLYTASKIAAEAIMGCFPTVPYTILRYGIPYGPWMRPNLVIPIFVRKALLGEPITIAGDGTQTRKFIYVEDIAKGHVAALENADKVNRKVLHLEGSKAISLKKLAEMLQEMHPEVFSSKVSIEYEEAREGDYKGVDVYSNLTKEKTGWFPTTQFEDGLRRTVAWLASQKG
jgi:UDP-glucose 4-epimerase